MQSRRLHHSRAGSRQHHSDLAIGVGDDSFSHQLQPRRVAIRLKLKILTWMLITCYSQ